MIMMRLRSVDGLAGTELAITRAGATALVLVPEETVGGDVEVGPMWFAFNHGHFAGCFATEQKAREILAYEPPKVDPLKTGQVASVRRRQ